jgi:hypothetical protein
MVRQVFVIKPRHYLKKSSVERTRNAARIDGANRTRRVEVVQVGTGPHDLHELCKGAASFRQPGFVRRQVTGDDVRRAGHHRAEVPASAQVRCLVDLPRLSKEGISAANIFVVPRTGIVAAVAIARPINQVAT